MARRSFSFLLARRYLNPRRSMLSSFSIISLIGVLLGVMVLVVVMAVMSGLERDVKARLLGFTPHVLLHRVPAGGVKAGIPDWREQAERMKTLPGVEAAVPYIGDNVILDVETDQRPVMFRGIDTSDPVQIEGIAKMLAKDRFPESSADMGLDDFIVISSTLADQYKIGVGQMVRLYSTRNFEEVMDAYKSIEGKAVREEFPEQWKAANEAFSSGWKKLDGKDALTTQALKESTTALDFIARKRIRRPEREQIFAILEVLDNAGEESGGLHSLPGENPRGLISEALASLAATDTEKMDMSILKGLQEIVLPKEAKVIGVYQAAQMTVTPDIFMPLPLAQTLAGLDDSVQGISLRMTDPYRADELSQLLVKQLEPGWQIITWYDQYEDFFLLINQQRSMMFFALSMIMLVCAFSMMAVMFTVTIQKRREIGVMKALGATAGQIIGVFLYQGMILGFVGAVLGVLLGRVVIHFRGELQAALRTIGYDPFTATFIGFPVLPAHNDWEQQFKFALMAFVLCSLAAFIPAFFAARSDAAKSLRNL